MNMIPAGSPRVIRKVTKWNKGKTREQRSPKEARDIKGELHMAKVKAAIIHECANKRCLHTSRLIADGTHYAALTDWSHSAPQGRLISGRLLPPDAHKYHPDCVPPAAGPLVRLLWPVRWKAETCAGSEPEDFTVRYFTSPEAWMLFTDKHHPSMRVAWSKNASLSNPPPYQLGTGYHWSMLTKV